jgi:autotransporter-associated beta strand protein
LVVGNYDGSTGRVELVGGVLATPIIDGRVGAQYTPPGGRSDILFDGGTLLHSTDGESWMPGQFITSFSRAALTERGAVIDSNGGSLTIPQALSNEVGYAGRFTKKGAGKLTLSAYNGFTGRVAVETGELAVTGAIYLTGGAAIDAGALLNLGAAGAVYGLVTASGTVSRIDGALTLKSGTVLTNGVGATLGGCGVVTGSVVFAAGSAYGRDKASGSGPLQVTAGAVFQSGAAVNLTGYTAQDLATGVPLLQAGPTGTIQVPGRMPVTLDGASYSTWWTNLSADGKTLTARVILFGTLIKVM